MASTSPPTRVRRAAPPFRRITVDRVTRLSPRMVRLTFTGSGLDGFAVDQPAASVRLLIPPEDAPLVIPTWDRNNFVLPDGGRPILRTFTPRRVDPATLEVDLDIVVHGEGPASDWAERAERGMETALSGPARGYTIDSTATDFLLLGDETAIPAIGQLLEVLPDDRPARAIVEVSSDDARVDLPRRASAIVEWVVQRPDEPPAGLLPHALADAVISAGTRVWAAGEAAAMQRVRRHLFDERQLPRSSTWVRGYWKHGRAGDDTNDE